MEDFAELDRFALEGLFYNVIAVGGGVQMDGPNEITDGSHSSNSLLLRCLRGAIRSLPHPLWLPNGGKQPPVWLRHQRSVII